MKKINIIFFAALIALAGISFFIDNVFSKDSVVFSGDYVKDELLVKFKSDPSEQVAFSALSNNTSKVSNKNLYKIKTKNNESLADLYKDLKENPLVDYVEPNYRVKMVLSPNDTYYPNQWHLSKMSASSGWDKTTGSSSVAIGVIDTGVDYAHEDLSSKIWNNPGETGSGKETNGVDDDSNGYIDDWRGYDFINNDNNASDDQGHGTAVAGIAASVTNNSLGVSGVSWGSKIVPLKVLDSSGSGTTAEVVEALDYARINNIPIVNMSLGSYATNTSLQDAVTNAYNANVFMAAATGNDNLNTILYPAKYSEVFAVGASDSTDMRCDPGDWGVGNGSNYGPEIDVVAPGVNIYTTDRTGSVGYNNGSISLGDIAGNYYKYFAGTSSASPQAAGLAALIKAAVPSYTNSGIMTSIKNSTDKVSSMLGQSFTQEYGYGRLNINKALSIYSWELVSQDSSKPLNSLLPGETAQITVSAKNTGTTTWLNSGSNPILLGTNNPKDRLSPFYTTGWINAARPDILNEATIAPGATGTFTFDIKAPLTPGNYSESYSLVAEGITWFNEQNLTLNISIASPTYSWQAVSQTVSKSLNGLSPGETVTLGLTVRNTGNVTWTNSGIGAVNLATTNPRDRISRFYDSATWLNAARPAKLNVPVAPGATGTFTWNIKVPYMSGQFLEYYSLVSEGVTWMNDPGLVYGGTVLPPTYTWQAVSQTVSKSLNGLSPGETVTLGLTVRNTGNVTWTNSGIGAVNLATARPRDRISGFYDSATWLNAARPAKLSGSVAPGATGTFTWNIKVPYMSGQFLEYYSLVSEGVTWMNDPGLVYGGTVNGSYGWQFISQSSDKNLAGLSPGETANISITAKNIGTATWFRTGSYPLLLGTVRPSSFYDSSTWLNTDRPTLMPIDKTSVAPGQSVTFTWTIKAPQQIGIYQDYYSLVLEGAGWLNNPGINFYIIVGWADTLEGVPMPATSGLTAREQHLSLSSCSESSSIHYSLSSTPASDRNGMAWETSGGCGYGAWGYSPYESSGDLSYINDERYYINMRWNYTSLHNQPIYAAKSWYYRKKILVVNPANGKKVVASIIEYGPAPWTGRVSGLSPEAMTAIGAITNSNLEYHWYLNQAAVPGPLN